jgi:hypothetical protein
MLGECGPLGRFGIHPAAAALDALTFVIPASDFRARESIRTPCGKRHLRFPHF